jgi:hypothetical protein
MLAIGSGRDETLSQQVPALVFVVTVRDNATLLDRCLRSIESQTYERTRCIVVDDASRDGSAAVAARWRSERPDLFTVHVNTQRRGKMANFYDAVMDVARDDVVIELDGDDELLSPEAASDLVRLHMRLDLVWTQHRVERHQWTSWPHFRSTDLPPAYRHRANLPRLRWTRSWHPSHLRSFKAWAFHRIDRDDLMVDGAWVQAASDFAYYTPLVEMTPPTLRYFYDRELTLYNITADNDKFREDQHPPGHRQSHVVDSLLKRPAYRTEPAPLWIGIIDSTETRSVVEKISMDRLASDPATWFMLAAEHPVPLSWHSRIQIIGQHTIAPSDAPAAPRHRKAIRWLERYATELGYHRSEDRPVYPDLHLRQLKM